MPFSMYGMIINDLHTKKRGMKRKRERKKPEVLKVTVHLKLTNVEIIRPEVLIPFYMSVVYVINSLHRNKAV
jgi:hypothetical protein